MRCSSQPTSRWMVCSSSLWCTRYAARSLASRESTTGAHVRAVVYAYDQGDSPAQVAEEFGAKHGLGAEGVVNVAKHINAKAGNFLKRVFFYYPFYVEVEGKSQMMNLTVYEDSDAKELGDKVAKKFGLPESSAERLRVAVEDEFLQRVKLKVNVDLAESGEKKMLLVLKTDTAETAARRFAVQNGISAAGQLVRHTTRPALLLSAPFSLCRKSAEESR